MRPVLLALGQVPALGQVAQRPEASLVQPEPQALEPELVQALVPVPVLALVPVVQRPEA